MYSTTTIANDAISTTQSTTITTSQTSAHSTTNQEPIQKMNKTGDKVGMKRVKPPVATMSIDAMQNEFARGGPRSGVIDALISHYIKGMEKSGAEVLRIVKAKRVEQRSSSATKTSNINGAAKHGVATAVSTTVSASRVNTSNTTSNSGSTGGMLKSMMQQINTHPNLANPSKSNITRSAHELSLEESGDARLFAVKLLDASQLWEGPDTNSNLIIKLPDFSFSGNNTVLLQCEDRPQPAAHDKVFTPVNIVQRDAPQTNVLCHFVVRAKPLNDFGGRSHQRGIIEDGKMYHYVVEQGYRHERWVTRKRDASDQQRLAVQKGQRFWLRIVIDQRGFCTYMNGKFALKSPHPDFRRIVDGEAIDLQIPFSGDNGERSTLVVHGVWMGHANLDEAAVKAPYTVKDPYAESNQQIRYVPDELYVSNLDSSTSVMILKQRFDQYDAVNYDLDSKKCTARIKLKSSESANRAIKETNNSNILGKNIRVELARERL